MRRLTRHAHQPFLEPSQKALEEFSRVGLRTLVFAVRVLSEHQFKAIEKRYIEAKKSEKSKELFKALSEQIETELVLLGCSAIEDNLQEQVPESIKKFSEANIKVWMITGDKFETAENIAYCAGIVLPEHKVFRFKNTKKDEFVEKVKELRKEFQLLKPGEKKSIILDTTRSSKVSLIKASFLLEKILESEGNLVFRKMAQLRSRSMSSQRA